MKNLHIYGKKLNAEDLALHPACFLEQGKPRLYSLWQWVTLGKFDQETPYFYMRSMDPDSFHSGNIITLGASPLSAHQGTSYSSRMVQKAPTAYKLISEDPLTFGFDHPDLQFRYYEGGCTIKESDILDLKMEFFPMAMVCEAGSAFVFPYIQQYAIVTGTFDGKEIRTIGGFDRMCELSIEQAANGEFCSGIACGGLRKDGRREFVSASVFGENGKGCGFYWIEGEEPYISDEVYLEADFYSLPYCDDGSATYKDSIWRFAGKEFHVQALYGSKGHKNDPRMGRTGFSHVYGPWYEGSTPYEHELTHTICENHNVTAENIRKAGFKLKANENE